MNLQFFRKHRKIFFVLMILAVFAMVTFGALGQLQVIIDKLRGDPAAKEVVLKIHGQDITRGRMNDVQAYMQHIARSELRQLLLGQLYYAEVFEARLTGQEPENDAAVKAALILLVEAEQAGLALSDEATESQFEQLTPEFREILLRTFNGQREHVLTALQMELTLQNYLQKTSEAAKILPEDVDERMRRAMEATIITEASIPAKRFMDQVPEPSEPALREQFERYRDMLPEQSPEGFGYMLPPRVSVEWLYMDVDEIMDTVSVTEEEIRKFYDENRDRYLIEAAADAGDAADEADEAADGEADANDAAAADEAADNQNAVESGADTGDADAGATEEPARLLEAPAAESTESGAVDSAEAVNSDNGNVADGAAGAAGSAGASNEPPAIIQSQVEIEEAAPQAPPAKQYRPLEEVRNEVIRDLRRQKAEEKIVKEMNDALLVFEQAPTIKLESVVDKMMHIASTDGLVTYEQAAELPNIGDAYQERQGREIPFASLALSVDPLQQGSGVYRNRPVGLLQDDEGSRYIFRVTEAHQPRQPQSLDEVRDRVVEDVKQIEAHKMAADRAEQLVKQAREDDMPLTDLARGDDLEVKADVAVTLGNAGEGSFQRKVIDTRRAGEKFGSYAAPDYSHAVVFEITDVKHISPEEYRIFRRYWTMQMQQEAGRQLYYRTLGVNAQSFQGQTIFVGIDLDALQARSNLQVVGRLDNQPQIEAGSTTNAAGNDDTAADAADNK